MRRRGVGGVHERRVHEIRAQLVLAAAVFLVAAHADVLVDLGAGVVALLLLRRERRGGHDRRRPSRPIQLRRHVLREDGDRTWSRPRAPIKPVGSPGNATPRPGVTDDAAAGRAESGQAAATATAAAAAAPVAPRAGSPASRPCSSAVRCHSGWDASAIDVDRAAARPPRRRSSPRPRPASPPLRSAACGGFRLHHLRQHVGLDALQAADRGVDDDRIRSLARQQRDRRRDAIRGRHLAERRGHLPPHVPVLVVDEREHGGSERLVACPASAPTAGPRTRGRRR